MKWTFDHFFKKLKTDFKWIILESIPCTGENQVLWKDFEWIYNDDTEHFMTDMIEFFSKYYINNWFNASVILTFIHQWDFLNEFPNYSLSLIFELTLIHFCKRIIKKLQSTGLVEKMHRNCYKIEKAVTEHKKLKKEFNWKSKVEQYQTIIPELKTKIKKLKTQITKLKQNEMALKTQLEQAYEAITWNDLKNNEVEKATNKEYQNEN